MAEVSGSNFLFLTDGRNSRGQPISDKLVDRVVRDVGVNVGIPDLNPHALPAHGLKILHTGRLRTASKMDRIANYLRGWSYLSNSASQYRGDQLTRTAYEAGLRAEKKRDG